MLRPWGKQEQRNPLNDYPEILLVVEGDSAGYSAYVPKLPSLLVTGRSLDEISGRAADAIRIYWELVYSEPSPTSTRREIEVEVPV